VYSIFGDVDRGGAIDHGDLRIGQSMPLVFIKFVSAVGCNQCDFCGITPEELRLFITLGAGANHGRFLVSDFVTITDGAIPQQAALERFFMNVVLQLRPAVRYSCRQQDCTTANDASGEARYEAVSLPRP
jgi:hypothetical protein